MSFKKHLFRKRQQLVVLSLPFHVTSRNGAWLPINQPYSSSFLAAHQHISAQRLLYRVSAPRLLLILCMRQPQQNQH